MFGLEVIVAINNNPEAKKKFNSRGLNLEIKMPVRKGTQCRLDGHLHSESPLSKKRAIVEKTQA